MRILFTNAGRRTYMMEFALSLNGGGSGVEIIAGDCDAAAPALHVPGVRSELFPPVLDDAEIYSTRLMAFVDRESVDLIIPLSDLDLEILATSSDALASTGCIAVVSPLETIKKCVDKEASYAFCGRVGLPMPASKFDADDCATLLPCVVKPIRGSGSADTRRIEKTSDLEAFVPGIHMIQQWISGTEYGLDILNDFHGRYVSACAKRKVLMRAGETDRSTVVHDAKIDELARRISAQLRHIGNLDVDVLEAEDGSLYCIDFNPRFGGGYAATHVAGMNYLQAVCNLAKKEPVSLPEMANEVTVMKGISVYYSENAA